MVGLLLLVLACEVRSTPPYASYVSPFEDRLIDETEAVFREVAARRNMPVHKMDHRMLEKYEGVKALDLRAFYDADALENRRTTVWITAQRGYIGVMFHGPQINPMPVDELDLFAYEMKTELEARVGLEFCRQDSRSFCTRESEQFEEEWEAAVRQRIDQSS